MHTILQYYDIPGSYFHDDEPLEETRYVERLELLHISSVVSYDWEKGWRPEGANKCPLKGMMADAIFFYHVVHTSNDNNSPAAVLR